MRLSLRIKVISTALLLGSAAGQAIAYPEITWSGAGSDTLWSTPANWSPAQIPGANDLVYFPTHFGGVQTTTLDTDRTIGSLNVKLVSGTGSQVIDLAGNTLQITHGIHLFSPNYFVQPYNGTLQVGTAEHPASMSWASTPGRGFDGIGVIMGSATRFDAVLSELVIADSSAFGQGFLWGGQEGSITIGSLADRGRFVVGRGVDSGTFNDGNVKLDSQTEFSATVDRFVVGESLQGYVFGIVTLAKSNYIDAQQIVVGVGQQAYGSLSLGETNTIVADSIRIGASGPGNFTAGRVEFFSSGNVRVGSPTQRADLDLGSRPTDSSPSIVGGILDLHAGTATGYFDQIKIGGGEWGKGTMSSGTDGLIDANQMLLAEGEHASGEFVLNGGTLRVQQILRGEGDAQFRWEAGRLDAREINVDLLHSSDTATLVVDGPTVINGDLDLGGGSIEIDLGHGGHLQINGDATIPGQIEILASDGFEPVSGTSYTLFEGIENRFSASPSQQAWQLGDYELRYDWASGVIHPRFDVIAYRYGDANLDNLTDGADYTVWADHFMTTVSGGYQSGDFNGDGWVDAADYIVWADHFSVASPATSISAVPEPSTLLLGLMAGIVALGRAYLRRPRPTRS